MQASNFKINNLNSEELTTDEKNKIIELAKEIGMEFPQKKTENNFNLKKEAIIIEIKTGSNADEIVKELYESGVIENKESFLKLIKKLGASNKILAGRYNFKTDVSLEKILLTIIGS
jgi:cell division protein YceG involved in septum cleavage